MWWEYIYVLTRCAPVCVNAKLVHIPAIKLGFMVDVLSYLMGVVNQQNITQGGSNLGNYFCWL